MNPDRLQPHLGSFSPSPLLFVALLGGEAVGVVPPAREDREVAWGPHVKPWVGGNLSFP